MASGSLCRCISLPSGALSQPCSAHQVVHRLALPNPCNCAQCLRFSWLFFASPLLRDADPIPFKSSHHHSAAVPIYSGHCCTLARLCYAFQCLPQLIHVSSKRSLAIPSPFAARRFEALPRKAVSLQCRAWPCPCGSNQVSAKPLLCVLGYSCQCRCLSVRPAAVAVA